MNVRWNVEVQKHLLLLSAVILTSFSFGIVSASWADTLLDKNHASCVSCHRMKDSEISKTNPFPEGIDPSSICLGSLPLAAYKYAPERPGC